MDQNIDTKEKIDTKVSVTVETSKITEANKLTTTKFKDNRGDIECPDDPRDYTAKIDYGKNIIWTGFVNNSYEYPKDTVAIKKVARYQDEKGGAELLRKESYDDKNTPGIVEGKVKPNYVPGTENYLITFKVKHNGITTQYTIDPKLIMNP